MVWSSKLHTLWRALGVGIASLAILPWHYCKHRWQGPDLTTGMPVLETCVPFRYVDLDRISNTPLLLTIPQRGLTLFVEIEATSSYVRCSPTFLTHN